MSLADVSLDGVCALLTGDVAAPVVLAVAALHHFLCVRVVASSAAHQIAAVAPARRLVALPVIRSRNETNKQTKQEESLDITATNC